MKKPLNIQAIEKQHLDVNGAITVHSIFYTIQGEGPFTGHPAVFVRLAGCNLRCPSCDTDYTSNAVNYTAEGVVTQIERRHQNKSCPGFKPLIVITGGEPFRQNIAKLVRILCSKGYKVQIETNGSLYVEDMPWDSITIVCSPKTGKIAPLLAPHIDAYKYVLSADSMDANDGLPVKALDHTASPKVARPVFIEGRQPKPIYLQPMDPGVGKAEEYASNLQACIRSCMKHGYILQIQTHKIIGLE
jgi:7-carboxy-7-deazaguanine synthase